ncbi:MAG: ArsR family transcriptional regulator [Candidatus Bathyarchaeota archaeon]|nr:ArsR family transcriptional regulator [Candidatus Bathyarchaeota archaeon]
MVNQQPMRSRGVKVLKAVSSPLRLQILNLLFDSNALSYTELMNQLKMNPSRDAGRFAYHLKYLLKADLVEADVEAKKYFLTDLGKMVLDVADRVEKKAVKPRGMMVRTSHLTVEEFDANKIANNLIREAKVPPELAQKAAKEAEKRLVKSKTKYLTAPLIREVVNSILVEKGYEDYRHKLTRVGMPIHEVTILIENKDLLESASTIYRAGQTVLGEYTLLNIFPRDIADAHLSGAIHINSLGTWLLKPNEVVHDIRYFFQHGIHVDDPTQAAMEPPVSFKAALDIVFNVLLHSSKETSRTQTFNYFNVALAPFVRGNDVASLKENLRLFLFDLNQHVEATLGLELAMSSSAAQKEAIGAQGKAAGKYGDYQQESQLVASLILDVINEESDLKPLLNPKIVIKINKPLQTDERAKALLLKAHNIAAKSGLLYFANLTKKDTENAAFSGSGVKFSGELTGDWETDTLRTGSLGCVTINLPRLVLESERDLNKFMDLLRERFELAARALSIKNNALKQFGKNSLPFLLQKSSGDTYFRLENCSRIVDLAGFKEAIEAFTEKPIGSAEANQFAQEVIATLLASKQKMGRKYGKRLYTVVLGDREASERLAQLDMERYGVAKVKFSGTREKPFYSTIKRIKIQQNEPLRLPSGLVEMARVQKGLYNGGSLDVFELEGEIKADALFELTKQLQETPIEFFTYNRVVSFCENCRKNYPGTLHKCPSCGSMSTLTTFDRFTST